MILAYISLVRTGGQTGPGLFYSTGLYLQDNYRNGNKPMRITEDGNRGQIPLKVILKLGWDELESLGRLEGLGVWERLGWSGRRLERLHFLGKTAQFTAQPWKDCPALERLPSLLSP